MGYTFSCVNRREETALTDIVSLEALVARIAPGYSRAVPADGAGVAMAATATLIEAGTTGLRLGCVPVSGLQTDLLIGARAVAAVETSAACWAKPAAHRALLPPCARVRSRSLRSVHASCSAAGIRANTGFDYDALEHLPATPQPDTATLAQLRGRNVEELAETYPAFAKLMMEPI